MTTQNYSSIKNASIVVPVANTDLGSNTSPYVNLFLSGNLTIGNAVATSSTLNVPKITSLSYPNSATAANPAGGETITVVGSGFLSGPSIYVSGVLMPSASWVNSGNITFTSPVKTVGSYTLAVVNSDGGSAQYVPGITYSNVPVFTTSAGTLGTINEGNAVSNTISATSDSNITFSITSGALPSGLAIASNGVISGTLANVTNSTTYNFTVGADDQENQLTTQNYSYTVNPDTITWNSPSNNASYSISLNSAISNIGLSATSAFGKSITYSATGLPTGLSVSGANITGTPTAGSGNIAVTVSATTSTKKKDLILSLLVALAKVQKVFVSGYNTNGELGLGTTGTTFTVTQLGSTGSTWARFMSGPGPGTHNGGIKTDGTLWLWGAATYGSLGNGDAYTAKSSPIQLGSGTNWSKLSGPQSATMAIKTDGTLWAWGYNRFGKLGVGNTTNYSSPVQVGSLTNWSEISSGYSHNIALKTDGTLWSFGYSGYGGACGLGDTADRSSPVQVGSGTTWSKISAGWFHSTAIKSDGTLWTWGLNNRGQLGDGTTTNRSSPVQVGSGTNWSLVSGGGYFTIAIKTDGTMWSWGYNNPGQLGLGDYVYRSSPTQIGALTTWSSVKTGRNHTIAIKTDGTLWSFGYNTQGQLGLGDTTDRLSPVQVGSYTDWSSVYPKYQSSIIIEAVTPTAPDAPTSVSASVASATSAIVYFTAPANNGYDTITTYTATSSPGGITGTVSQAESGSITVTGLTTNTSYTFTVTATNGAGTSSASSASNSVKPALGKLYTWGYNLYGQLGVGTSGAGTDVSTPTQIGSDTNWRLVTTTQATMSAIKMDGTLWNWGTNSTGQLLGSGNGSTGSSHSSPAQQGSDTNWKLISGTIYSMNAIKTNNTRYGWGSVNYNPIGQLYDGYHGPDITSPTQFGSTTYWSTISSAAYAGFGIKTDGTLWHWGRGLITGSGQYGRSSPCQVGSGTTWASVSTSDGHALAIKTNGTLWVMGGNSNGQLGLNNTSNVDNGFSSNAITEPTQVGSNTTWLKAFAGYAYSLALKTDGTLWAWGRNTQGQLGLSDTTDRSSPVQVGALTSWATLPIKSGTTTQRHTGAIKSDGTLWMWGFNYFGQLGFGDTTQRNSPVQVGSGTGWSALYIGGNQTAAISG
jgi:alpha-tubulin suppressor-like RCC1 family protein